jgi:hypothetical protein
MQILKAAPFICAGLALLLVISYNQSYNTSTYSLISRGHQDSVVVNGVELQPIADDEPALSSAGDIPDSIVVNGVQLHSVSSIQTPKTQAPRKAKQVIAPKKSTDRASRVLVNGIELQPIMAKDAHEVESILRSKPANNVDDESSRVIVNGIELKPVMAMDSSDLPVLRSKSAKVPALPVNNAQHSLKSLPAKNDDERVIVNGIELRPITAIGSDHLPVVAHQSLKRAPAAAATGSKKAAKGERLSSP